MKKRLLAVLLTSAMAVTLFAGCGTPGSSDSGSGSSSVILQIRSRLLWILQKETVFRTTKSSMPLQKAWYVTPAVK